MNEYTKMKKEVFDTERKKKRVLRDERERERERVGEEGTSHQH